MNKKLSKDFLYGFKVASMINGTYNDSLTDEKIERITSSFVDIASNELKKAEGKSETLNSEKHSSFLKINGESFFCPCGSNLFHQVGNEKWHCNCCENVFESK